MDTYEVNVNTGYGIGGGFYNFAWTTEKPTQDGWYWVYIQDTKNDSKAEIVYVEKEKEGFGVWHSFGDWDEFRKVEDYSVTYPCFWLGPLPLPMKPE